MKIFMLEDEQPIAQMVTTFLESKGHKISWYKNGHEGLCNLSKIDKGDCVICDYNMPLVSGIEFIQALRELNRDIPVILFTGHTKHTLIETVPDSVYIVFNKDAMKLIDYIDKLEKTRG